MLLSEPFRCTSLPFKSPTFCDSNTVASCGFAPSLRQSTRLVSTKLQCHITGQPLTYCRTRGLSKSQCTVNRPFSFLFQLLTVFHFFLLFCYFLQRHMTHTQPVQMGGVAWDLDTQGGTSSLGTECPYNAHKKYDEQPYSKTILL